MGFILYSQHININTSLLWIECDIYATISALYDFDDLYNYEYLESYLEHFFCYFNQTLAQKWLYAQHKLDREAYSWGRFYKLCPDWSLLQCLLYYRYTEHLLVIEILSLSIIWAPDWSRVWALAYGNDQRSDTRIEWRVQASTWDRIQSSVWYRCRDRNPCQALQSDFLTWVLYKIFW